MNDKTRIASAWRRLIAGLIDAVMWLAVWEALIFLVASSDTQSALFGNILNVVIAALFLSPLQTFISGFLMTHFGGTIGKLLTGVEITDENGKHLSFWRAVFRQTIGYTASGLLFWLGFIWIFIDKERQGWHDQMAGTFVVTKRKPLVWLGLAGLIVFLMLDIWMGKQIVSQFVLHRELYQELFSELRAV